MTPAPGIYENIPAEVYHQSWEAASASRLKLFARSPRHMREAIDNPPERTPALILGDAAHLRILQPDLFSGRYVVAGPCTARKKDGAECGNPGKAIVEGEWRCGVHVKSCPPALIDVPAGILNQDDHDRCRRMGDAVRAHRAARDMLDGRRHTELAAVWRCPETNVLCKLRADALCDWDGTGVVADLKTTEDASREAFERSVWNYKYYCQAAHYTSGLAALGKIYDHFVIIAVEKEPPHAVAVYRITDEVMAVGREEVLSLLRGYAKCVESGVWPAYPQEIQDLGIPPWAMKQLERVA